jgi:Bacterial Ig-like domain (group 3)
MSFGRLSKTVALFLLGLLAVLGLAAASAQSPRSAQSPHSAQAIPTTTTLIITSPGTIFFGQNIDGFASVSSSDGSSLTGTIAFYDGTRTICVVSATKAASCPASSGQGFAVGTHVITAAYSGDATHSASSSNPVTITVLPDAPTETTTTLTSNMDPASSGQEVTFTADVFAATPVTAPTGLVTFFDGTEVLGTADLAATGSASFSTASLNAGSHNITASYGGDQSNAPSVSGPLTETVTDTGGSTDNGFSLAVTGSTTVGVGRMTNLLVSVTEARGYSRPIDLSCADLPSEAACTFGVHTIPAGGGSTTLEFSTIAPHDCGSSVPYFESAAMPFAGPALAGIAILFLPGRRNRIRRLLIALVCLSGLAGCGNCTDLGTRPGSYTIKVIGTPSGASTALSAKVKMDVILK